MAVLRSVSREPRRCPIDWDGPTPVGVSPVLGQLIHHLDGPRPRRRGTLACLEACSSTSCCRSELRRSTSARPPTHAPGTSRGRSSTTRFYPRTLQEWCHAVGACSRTLARAFVGASTRASCLAATSGPLRGGRFPRSCERHPDRGSWGAARLGPGVAASAAHVVVGARRVSPARHG